MSGEVLELSWFLRREDGSGERRDMSPCKAHFCLKWGTEIVDHKEYTKAELKEEIVRLREIGERPIEYEEALKELSSIG